MPRVVAQVGDDPDPTPYLFVSLEQKRIDQSKPYDGKKACWVPDDKEGFVQGEIKATKGELVTVSLPGGEVRLLQYFWPMSSSGIGDGFEVRQWKDGQVAMSPWLIRRSWNLVRRRMS